MSIGGRTNQNVVPPMGTPATDRWFLKVVDGSVVGKSLKACAWCDTNSLRLDSTHKQMTTMEIKTILNEGPADQFQLIGSKGRVLPNVLKAPTTAVIIPRNVKAKPSTVGDAPIFKDLVTVQTAAPPNAVVLAKVVELRKQQEDCTHDMFCVCPACS